MPCFSKNNGSIKNCSEELFIHKNTLQYRLNKFHSLTGYTPRNYDDYHILKLAFLLVQT
nr:helix-turn-helix domain-containing protein [Enterococcus faecium]